MSHLTGRHTYMTTHQGQPRPPWDDLIGASTTTGSSLTTCGRRSGRKRSVGTTGAVSAPACWNSWAPFFQCWDHPWLLALDPWSPASHIPHTCQLCGEWDTVSSAKQTGPNRCAQCSQLAACPWPEPPAGLHRRTGRGAVTTHRGRADPLACPSGPRGCHPPVEPRAPHLTPCIAEPAAQCPAEGEMGRSSAEPAARWRRQPSRAW